jgi:cytochrome oxidase Cu insertion factor (SCO1/SenC/PrrC family)
MKDHYAAIALFATLALAAPAVSGAASSAPTSAKAPESNHATSRPSASQPATAPMGGTSQNQDWHKNPNIRILGFTPYQFLYICIGVIAVINVLALVVIAIGVVRSRRENAALARNQTGKSS